MKAPKVLLLVLAAVLTAMAAVAQTQSDLMLKPQTNEIIPPAPASARQIRYQSPQPALATGAVNLSVPLYTVEAEGLSIPFSLSYHTSGIKPLDDPFPCGYGWALQPALRIVRTVRGRADEHFEYWGEKISHQDLRGDRHIGYACMVAEIPHLGSSISERYDSEKDIFTISLPSGVYTRIMLKGDDGRITFVGGECDNEIIAESSGTLDEITVTDAHGIIYHFGSDFIEQPEPTALNVTNFTTSWGIKDIILPSGRKIEFDWTYFFHPDKKIFGGDVSADMLAQKANVDPKDLRSEAMYALSVNPRGQYKKRMHLSDVSFPGGRIAINYADTTMSSFAVIAAGDTVRNIRFNYGKGVVEHKFLKEIDLGGEGKYSFEYDPQRFEALRLWHRLDWWGFYNGRHPYGGDGNTCLTPRIGLREIPRSMHPGYEEIYEIGQADRTPDENAMKAGILKSVTYPTGVRSEFEYEAHRFPPMRVDAGNHITEDTDPLLDMGGGLRVKSIATLSQQNDTLQYNSFSYDSVVVTAVPSAATFVSVSYAVGLTDINGEFEAFDYRQTHVGHSSDYMQNHIGEADIWYSKVTEFSKEGKTEYRFAYVNPISQEHRDWGVSYPLSLNNVFSHGPSMTQKTVFRDSVGGYKAVETTEYVYEKTGWDAVDNSHISRVLLQCADRVSSAPDFTDGEKFQFPDLVDRPNIKTYKYIDVVCSNHLIANHTPYRISCYELNLISERLKSKIVTQHLYNGDFTQTETYEYKPGTSIVTSLVTTNPADSRIERIDISYPSASGTPVERDMLAANMTAVPVKTVQTFGSATIAVRREMAAYGHKVYRPAREWMSRGSDEWLVGSYDYDSYGNLRQYIGIDSVPAVYLWGYSSTQPVYGIIGADFAEISRQNPGAAITGSAEKAEIQVLPGCLVSKTLWKPLVGVVSQRQPCGLTSTYIYDSSGRLTGSAIEGHGPVDAYTYHILDKGYNYTTAGVYRSATADTAVIRQIVNYDGLGREISQLTAAPAKEREELMPDLPIIKAQAQLPSILPFPPEYTATYTEYDAMDRPVRQWSPVRSLTMHPSAADIAAGAIELYGSEHAFATTFYDASQRGLQIASRKAGEEWHSADRRVTIRHLVNTASGDLACPDCYTIPESSKIIRTNSRFYPAGALTVEKVTDEEGLITMTFTDRRGKTIMIREGTHGDWNDTHFMYNDYGDLLFVVQPEHTSFAKKTACFRYEYDARGNCTFKSVPGGTETRYRYDTRNRLFAEQDGNLKDAGLWLIHHYDRLGRPAFNAYAEATETTIADLCSNSFTVTLPGLTCNIANSSGGYSRPAELDVRLPLTELAEAHYYDRYNFASDLTGNWNQYTPPAGYPSPRTSVVGLETATAAGSHLSLKHYDNAGRVIHEVSGDMALPPEHEIHTLYDYEGKVIEQTDMITTPRTVSRVTRNTYWGSGHLKQTEITQNDSTATVRYHYDGAGRIDTLRLGKDVVKAMSYNANGWLTRSSVSGPLRIKYPPVDTGLPLLPRPQTARAPALKSNIFDETLHYADAAAAGTPRYDGKISVRSGDNALTAYGYDCHGRLISSTSYSYRGGAASADFSTEYTYDRNANLLNVTRNGIIDNVRGTRTYGIHNDITMTYEVNRLKSAMVEADGAGYEGRTGLPQHQSSGTDFTYDSNGNMTSDAVRGIVEISYNRLNLPERLTFADGHRQTISYDGFGRKTRVDYAQGPETVFGGDLPADGDYGLTSSRVYAGPHIFADGQLEYSAFDGGYFNAAGSPCYYITDWQGNNAAVVDSEGTKIQSAAYYPYGEPTVEPKGQRFLFGGKEREHAGGRNAYDFGARSLTPFGSWPSPDPKAEDFYQISPFSYCAGDPINRIDRDGKEWTITEVENDHEQIIELRINGVLINLSSKKHDLNALSIAISKQLESIFTVNAGGVNSIMEANIRAISAIDEISQSDHVIAIVDLVDSEINALASIDKVCGLRIKIGNEIATETISGENSRTVAHEIGHSGGLKHTNKEPYKDSNLMTQISHISKGIDINDARYLNMDQIYTIVDNYKKGNLNKSNWTINGLLWPFTSTKKKTKY